jgi:hypothetical protein
MKSKSFSTFELAIFLIPLAGSFASSFDVLSRPFIFSHYVNLTSSPMQPSSGFQMSQGPFSPAWAREFNPWYADIYIGRVLGECLTQFRMIWQEVWNVINEKSWWYHIVGNWLVFHFSVPSNYPDSQCHEFLAPILQCIGLSRDGMRIWSQRVLHENGSNRVWAK